MQVDQNTEETWEMCIAEVKILANDAQEFSNIAQKALSSETVYPEEILTEVLGAMSKVKENVKRIERKCKTALHKVCENRSKVGVLEDDNDLLNLQDPADRPSTLNDQQKQTVIKNGPYQPMLKSYPDNPDIRPNKQRRFAPSWYKEFPHLEYSVKRDSVSCFVCSLFPSGVGRERSSEAWIKSVKSWDKMKSRGKDDKGKLAQHFCSSSHKAALQELAHFANNMAHIDVMLDQQLRAAKIQEEENNIRNQQVIKILFDVAKTLARQQLAFRGHDESDGNFIQIIYLVARHNTQLKAWLTDNNLKPYSIKYLSAYSQNEFISLLAEDVKARIINDLESAEMYSVMADTSPDTANTDRLVVAVRYVDEQNSATERTLQMKEAIDKTGEGQAKEILDSLESRVSSTEGLVYQSYDYTASMSGVYKGAQQCLQDKVGRSVPYTPCQGHRY